MTRATGVSSSLDWQIHFVADQNLLLAGKFFQIIRVCYRQTVVALCVEDVQDQFGLCEGFAAAADAFALNFIV